MHDFYYMPELVNKITMTIFNLIVILSILQSKLKNFGDKLKGKTKIEINLIKTSYFNNLSNLNYKSTKFMSNLNDKA